MKRGSFLELMRKDWKDLFKEDEIAQANLNALEHHNPNYHAINIGTGKPITIKNLAETLTKRGGDNPS